MASVMIGLALQYIPLQLDVSFHVTSNEVETIAGNVYIYFFKTMQFRYFTNMWEILFETLIFNSNYLL